MPRLEEKNASVQSSGGSWVGWASRLPGSASRGTHPNGQSVSDANNTSALCRAGCPPRQAGRPPYPKTPFSCRWVSNDFREAA